jgi:DNA-binding IclR family transcriptional regulator
VQRLEDGRYALGPEIARLQTIYTAAFSMDAIVQPVLRELVDKTRESASFHVRQGDARVCLYRVDSRNRSATTSRWVTSFPWTAAPVGAC